MGKAIRLSEDMAGKKVKLVNRKCDYNPKNGSIGTIIDYDPQDNENMHYYVHWDCGWDTWPLDEEIEEYDENNEKEEAPNMTNKEIWEMLLPKLKKNNLTPYWNLTGEENHYYESDIINAIAVAYKSGYIRAMKGRPFKFGEKKQSGHWEPVDPNNLPKEGTKVMYVESRGHVFGLYDGDTGTVVSGLGFSVNMNRINLVIHTSKIIGKYFDMWVEDDE